MTGITHLGDDEAGYREHILIESELDDFVQESAR